MMTKTELAPADMPEAKTVRRSLWAWLMGVV
jgi:hypothetical protein